MTVVRPVSVLVLTALFLAALLAACGGAAPEETAEPVPTSTAIAEVEPPEPEATSPPEDEGSAAGDTPVLGEVLETRTPEPTATPGQITRAVTQFTARTDLGLSRTSFLGLATDDWINLGISVLFVLAGYVIGTWLIRRLVPQVVRRTPTELDDRLLEVSGPQVRWLVVIFALQFATQRLIFLSAELKAILGDVYFVAVLWLCVVVVWKLIGLAHEWYRQELAQEGRAEELDPVLVLLTRLGYFSVVMIGLTILLSYFGINVTALVATLGILGLALSLAAQDTLSDAISGFIILADQPFRIGDRIEIQGEGTWGDVTEIGLRTTRIRTRDNRMVIVPNSLIGKNQVINYTFPDPRYRIQTHVGVAYGTDIETARRVLIDAVRGVEGVLPDKPVDALYNEMGDSAMIFRVRWWIGSYEDTRRVIDRVHTALQEALDVAGIVSPYPTQSLNLHFDPETTERHLQSPRKRDQTEPLS